MEEYGFKIYKLGDALERDIFKGMDEVASTSEQNVFEHIEWTRLQRWKTLVRLVNILASDNIF